MRYHANIRENIINAVRANDKALAREIVLDEIVTLIEESPNELAEALRKSKVTVSTPLTKEELIDKSAYALINNPIFQKNIAVVFAAQEENRTPAREEFASFGKNKDKGGGSKEGGGGGGGAVSSIADAVSSVFGFATATQNLKSEEEKAKAAMYSKIFGKEKKRNWMPIVVIGGVLLIGALVVWRVTARKK
jgi:hypothetical protein